MNEEIFSGLKAALERGQSLKNAMMSFYNAGYDKTEIEEAARALVTAPEGMPVQVIQPIAQAPQPTTTPSPAKPIPSAKPVPAAKPKETFAPGKVVQKVSNYGKRSLGNKIIVIVLALLLFMLASALIGIFIFRSQIIDWLNSIF